MKFHFLLDGFAFGVVVHRFNFIGPTLASTQWKQGIVVGRLVTGGEKKQAASSKDEAAHGYFSGT